jgi:hypothetical protein
MTTVVKKEKKRKIKGQAVLSATVGSYANDPYFEKKAADAKQAIESFGLPVQKH